MLPTYLTFDIVVRQHLVFEKRIESFGLVLGLDKSCRKTAIVFDNNESLLFFVPLFDRGFFVVNIAQRRKNNAVYYLFSIGVRNVLRGLRSSYVSQNCFLSVGLVGLSLRYARVFGYFDVSPQQKHVNKVGKHATQYRHCDDQHYGKNVHYFSSFSCIIAFKIF